MDTSANLTHIADTAVWVATFRAIESERPDPAFRDPLARVLTGERGLKIAETMGYMKIMGWVMLVRTVAIDEMIKHAIANGIDTVVNLGAGLDTRPYRMDLPASLRWIEIDFPQMIQYKKEKLKAETPGCRLEHIEADLSDIPSRRILFERLGAESKKVLLITEGVIPYLDPNQAEALSRDLAAVPSFKYWIMDYRQGGVTEHLPPKWRETMKATPFKFTVVDSLGFFEKHGWRVFENRLAADEGDRLKRPFPMIFPWSYVMKLMPKKTQLRYRNATGYVMYEKPAGI